MAYNEERKKTKYRRKSKQSNLLTWLVIVIAAVYTTFLQSKPRDTKPETVKTETINDISGYSVKPEQTKTGTDYDIQDNTEEAYLKPEQAKTGTIYDIPEYSGETYAVINDNVPFFTAEDMTIEAFETYSDFDSLGRCGVAYANACRELMPRKKRGDISHIKPTGWVQRKYPGIVDSEPPYLYNRSHLIAYSLTAEMTMKEISSQAQDT